MSHFETRNGPILTDIFIFIKLCEHRHKNLINLNNLSHFKTKLVNENGSSKMRWKLSENLEEKEGIHKLK